jgi:Nucleosome assembly protein (NAP)
MCVAGSGNFRKCDCRIDATQAYLNGQKLPFCLPLMIVLLGHSQISEKDEPILSHLIDISCEELDEENTVTGYRLHFKFAKNPYFEEEILVCHLPCLPESCCSLLLSPAC